MPDRLLRGPCSFRGITGCSTGVAVLCHTVNIAVTKEKGKRRQGRGPVEKSVPCLPLDREEAVWKDFET